MIRAFVALSSYGGLTWLLLVMFCIWPERVLALVSPAAYARVVAQAEWIAYQAATKPAIVSAVAEAASATSPASLAIRAVAGPVGWAALGVAAGLAFYQIYYGSSDLSGIKEGARPPGTATTDGLPGYTFTDYASGPSGNFSLTYHPADGGTATFSAPPGYDQMTACSWPGPCPNPQAGWAIIQNTGGAHPTVIYGHYAGNANPYTAIPGPDPTPSQVSSYVNSLPESSPASIPNHTTPLGSGGASPTPASNVQTVPVSPAEMPTIVKPASQVSPTDIKVADNVPPPSGTQIASPATQSTTKTTTTTTNPDGSTTTQEEETTTPSCTIGDHDARTFQTVYEQHSAAWQNTGLLQAVNLLKTLTWPSTLPVVTLPSAFFGSQHVDFNDWSFAFVALRTLVIAIATLAAYRIVFVGGR